MFENIEDENKTFKSYFMGEQYNTKCLPVDTFIKKASKEFSDNGMNEENGLINLATVFSNKNIKSLLAEYNGKAVNNISDLVAKYGNWIVKSKDASSSMLQDANVNGSIDYAIVKLVSPENDLKTISITFLGYDNPLTLRTLASEKMVILFDDTLDSEFMAYQFINSNYTLSQGGFKFNGIDFNFTVDAELLSDDSYIYIASSNKKYYFDTEFYSDLTDKNNIKSNIEELLNEELSTNSLKVSNFRMQFVCTPNN